MSTTLQQVPTGTYGVDPVHSSFGFGVRYNGVATFRSTLRQGRRAARRRRADRLRPTCARSSIDEPRFKDHLLARRLLRRREHADDHLPLDRHPARRGRHGGARRRPDHPRRDEAGDRQGVPTPPAATRSGTTASASRSQTTVDRREFGLNWQMAEARRLRGAGLRRHHLGRPAARQAGLSDAHPRHLGEPPSRTRTTRACSGRRRCRCRPGSSSSSSTAWATSRTTTLTSTRIRRPRRSARLREAIAGADGVLIATPGVQRLDPRRAQERARLGLAAVPRQRAAGHARRRGRRLDRPVRRGLGAGGGPQGPRRSIGADVIDSSYRSARRTSPSATTAIWPTRASRDALEGLVAVLATRAGAAEAMAT